MTTAEMKARNLISQQSTEALLDHWELTTYINDEHIPMVRGWLMDEFEKRNPEAFNRWLDSYEEDDALRKYITA